MQTFECTQDGITRCAQIIERGGVVAFPTDTVYGLGCDPYNNSAVRRVFEIKGRKENKPLPVLVLNMSIADEIIHLGPTGKRLAERFWPGALTIVAPVKDNSISAAVTTGKKSLAVRVPANTCTLGILKICKHIVGTSANLSGRAAPTNARSVIESLQNFDAILIDGNAVGGKASTIVDVTGTNPIIIRQGVIETAEIMKVLGNEGI